MSKAERRKRARARQKDRLKALESKAAGGASTSTVPESEPGVVSEHEAERLGVEVDPGSEQMSPEPEEEATEDHGIEVLELPVEQAQQYAGGRVETSSRAAVIIDESSEYITGPIEPPQPQMRPALRQSAPVVAPVPARAPQPEAAPVAVEEGVDADALLGGLVKGEDESDEDEDEDGEGDEDDEDDDGEDDDGEDDDGDGEEGDDEDDDEPVDEEEALFNIACAAIEQGSELSWGELISWVCSAEVEDPRLALLVALIAHDDFPKLTGAQVLEVYKHLELDDLVEEAREVIELGDEEPGGGKSGKKGKVQAVVRTTARELRQQAEEQFGPRKRVGAPVKSSDIRKGREAAKDVAASVPQPAGRKVVAGKRGRA